MRGEAHWRERSLEDAICKNCGEEIFTLRPPDAPFRRWYHYHIEWAHCKRGSIIGPAAEPADQEDLPLAMVIEERS